VLQYAPKGEEYSTYLKLKKEYGSTPSFYIDASDFFSKSGNKEASVRILSNLAELMLESPQLLRTLGKKLLALNCNAEALMVFKKVLEIKEEEPQSYRDLGLAYEANGNSQQAVSTLYEVVKKEWDVRFHGIELIVLNEINNLIAIHPKLDYSFIDERLVKKEPVDIRVVLTWDTDNCDIDLWVTDPSGEKCFYENKLTRLGGKISDDFTGGYGPEEYMIKKAIQGDYKVQANYYGTRSQSQLAPVNLHLTFITNFGKPNQKKQEVTIRLEDQKDIIDVGKFNFSAN
jgi:tetratricopeptide (TPR) repeat protein